VLDKSRNIFPFLFSFSINDIEQYLEDNGVKSLYMINENSFFFVERYKLISLCKIKILSAVEWAFLNPACADDNKPISSDKLGC
jgi:hypothetical protein